MKPMVAQVKNVPQHKWPEGKLPYTLEGRGRIELLTEIYARVRNSHREQSGYSGRWVPTPNADPASVVEPVRVPTGKEREQLLAAGRKRDAELWAEYEAKRAGGSLAKQPAALASAAAPASPKPAAVKAPKTANPWSAIGMCGIVRWCSSKGWSMDAAEKAARACGYTPAPNTLRIQMREGAKKKDLPKLTPEQVKELEKHFAPAEAPKPAAKKPAPAKAKPAKSPLQKLANKMRDEGMKGGVSKATLAEMEKATKAKPSKKSKKK